MRTMYCVTRNGERVAGSLAVPFEAAYVAANLLNQEYRRRSEFGVELDDTATPWEENQVGRLSTLVDNVLGTC